MVVLKLHPDCRETWRAELLEQPDSPEYLCTRHLDGSVVCNEHARHDDALQALRTFLATARSIGYRIDQKESAEITGQAVARQEHASLAFWLSDRDETSVEVG